MKYIGLSLASTPLTFDLKHRNRPILVYQCSSSFNWKQFLEYLDNKTKSCF